MSDSFNRVVRASAVGAFVILVLWFAGSVWIVGHLTGRRRAQSLPTLETLRIIDAAHDQYAIEANKGLTHQEQLRLIEAAKAQYALETRQSAK